MSRNSFLESLNNAVADLPRPGVAAGAHHFPVFIIGLPRSGSTVTYQAISKYLKVGYITNIAARFWQNPCVGIQLSREIVGDGREHVTHFSNYGNTESASDPHEFGHFWKRWVYSGLGGSDELSEAQLGEIDWHGLGEEIQRMMTVWLAPMVFKQLRLGLFAGRLSRELKKARFVILRRSKSEIAVSVLKCRRRRYGTDAEWFGLKPHHYKELQKKPPLEQIIEKINYLDELLSRQTMQISPERYRCLEYRELIDAPAESLRKLAEFFNVEMLSTDIALHLGKNPVEEEAFVSDSEISYFNDCFG